MKAKALQNFTRQKLLISQNSMQILDKFLQYAKCCSDPHNIFSYMEEKSICVYLAHYWVAKAQYCAQIGDFRAAFDCLREGASRSDIITEDQINFIKMQQRFALSLVLAIKSSASLKRRTRQQHQLLNSDFQANEDNIEKLLKIYQGKYPQIRQQLQTKWQAKVGNQGRIASWMLPIYEKRQQKLMQVAARYSIGQMQAGRIKSLTTPIKKSGLKKLNKTIDSVQLLKRKKKQDKQTPDNQNNDIQQNFEFASSRKYNSVPVGRLKTQKKVTFTKESKQRIDLNRIRQRSHSCLRKSPRISTSLMEEEKDLI